MDLVVFSETEIIVVLRSLREVAAANGSFTEAEADFVEAVGRLHGVIVDAHALAPITLEEVRAAIQDPHRRKRAVQLAIVASLIEGQPDARAERAVILFAEALGVPEAGLKVVHDMAGEHALLARFDMMRRMRRFISSRAGGMIGMLRLALPMLGFPLEDQAVAARFRALGNLPTGTFGRALHDFYEEHGFAVPGDTGGVPERFMFHDVGHVLSGYGVDPQGEIQQAAFQAGYIRDDGFLFLLFGIMQFHLGHRLTPIAEAETGYFDPERVLRAAARGAACKVDLSNGFDFWAHAAEPLESLRSRLGVPPLAA